MQTAILCRTNAPLVKCAFDLLKRGCRIRFLGKDIAKKLKETMGQVLGHRRRSSVAEFSILLNAWIQKLRERYKDEERRKDFLAEQEDCYGSLAAIAENCPEDDTTEAIYVKLDEFFVDAEAADDPTAITLSSGHRVKGLEYKRTVIIRPDLLPHPAAATEADQKQEEHLRYVLFTRHQEELIVCHDQQPK